MVNTNDIFTDHGATLDTVLDTPITPLRMAFHQTMTQTLTPLYEKWLQAAGNHETQAEMLEALSAQPVFSIEQLDKLLDSIEAYVAAHHPANVRQFQNERNSIARALESGSISRSPHLVEPAEQLAWAAALGYAMANPQIQANWQPSNRAIRINQTTLWKDITSTHRLGLEMMSHANLIKDDISALYASDPTAHEDEAEVNAMRNTRMRWGAPGSWFYFSRSQGLINIDLIATLTGGIDHARAAIQHEIGHAFLSTEIMPEAIALRDRAKELEAIRDAYIEGKGPIPTQEQFKEYARTVQQFNIMNNIANASEDNNVNTYAVKQSAGQDFGYSMNFINVILAGTGKIALDVRAQGTAENVDLSAITSHESNKLDADDNNTDSPDQANSSEAALNAQKHLANLQHAINLCFFQRNGLFENTPEGWKSAGVRTDWLEEDPNYAGATGQTPQEALARIQELCEFIQNAQVPNFTIRLGGEALKQKLKELMDLKNGYKTELWERYAKQYADIILEHGQDKLQEKMDEMKSKDNQQDKNEGSEAQEEDGQDGQEQDGEGQEGEGQDGQEQDGEGQEGKGQDEQEQDGEGQEGKGQDGQEQDGEGQEGEGQDEQEQDGEGQEGKGQDGQEQDGEGQEGKGQGKSGDQPSAANNDSWPVEGLDGNMDNPGKIPDNPSAASCGENKSTDKNDHTDKGEGAGKGDQNESDTQDKGEGHENNDGEENNPGQGEAEGNGQDKGAAAPQEGNGEGESEGESLEDLINKLNEEAAKQKAEEEAKKDAAQNNNTPRPDPLISAAGKAYDMAQLPVGDWSQYAAQVTTFQIPILRMANELQKLIDKKFEYENERDQDHTIKPKNNQFSRLNTKRVLRNVIRRETGQPMSKEDFAYFQTDRDVTKPALSELYIEIDLSGSMSQGKSPNRRMDAAIQFACIMMEAGKKVGMDVFVRGWGEEGGGRLLASPYMTTEEIGKNIDGVKDTAKWGTILQPAMAAMNRDLAKGYDRSPAQWVGNSHLVIISDGDIGDADEAIAYANSTLSIVEALTMDFLIMNNTETNPMAEMAATISSSRPRQVGVQTVPDGDVQGFQMAGFKAVLKRIQHSIEEEAIPRQIKCEMFEDAVKSPYVSSEKQRAVGR